MMQNEKVGMMKKQRRKEREVPLFNTQNPFSIYHCHIHY